jgi:hypothetical protein
VKQTRQSGNRYAPRTKTTDTITNNSSCHTREHKTANLKVFFADDITSP